MLSARGRGCNAGRCPLATIGLRRYRVDVLRRNVLIFHAGALGDFVVSWPLALALGRLHPQSRIIYVAAGQKGKLAEKAIRTESLDIEAGWHHLFGAASSLPQAARKTLENAHSIFTFVASPGDVWSESVRAIAPEAQVVHIEPRPPEGSTFGGHITQWMAEQLSGVPVIRTGVDQIMRSIAQRGVGYKRSPEGTVCVHPGGGAEAKRWPAKHYVQLVRKLVKGRHHVRVLIGEVEREQLPKEDLDHFAAVAELVEPKTYVELLDHLGTADALVCNDTGPGHLAGIIGTPTFSIFGPESNVDRWRPLGPHVHVKQTEDLAHLSVEEVFKWVSGEI
jgi:ADP-heptose:LPS heptosyltransferase